MTHFIDLRSDTVTKPTPAMRKVMVEAEVGDDVFGEDPTVNALQEKVAEILEKEAAIFVPSGTMANQLAIKSHTQPGDEVIIEASSHPYNFEGGAGAALSGVQFYCIKGNRGILDASQIEEAIRSEDHHFPVCRVVILDARYPLFRDQTSLPRDPARDRKGKDSPGSERAMPVSPAPVLREIQSSFSYHCGNCGEEIPNDTIRCPRCSQAFRALRHGGKRSQDLGG